MRILISLEANGLCILICSLCIQGDSGQEGEGERGRELKERGLHNKNVVFIIKELNVYTVFNLGLRNRLSQRGTLFLSHLSPQSKIITDG